MKKILTIMGIVITIPVVAVIGWFVFVAVSLTGMTATDKAQYNKAALRLPFPCALGEALAPGGTDEELEIG